MKYILEIKPEYEANGIMILGARDSHLYVTTLEVKDLEELNSDYINEYYGSLQDEAYQRGYDNGYEDGCATAFKPVSDAEYQRGLEDGKAQSERGCEGCMYQDKTIEHHPCGVCCNAYNNRWTAKQTDDEIKVGDEVYACMPSGKTQPFVIIKIYDEDGVKYYSGINADGNHVQGGLNYIKTGRHFPHVAELLKEMQS